MMTHLMALAALLCPAALAQDKPDERTKRILERIEKEIQASHAKLLDDIRLIIRTELGKGGARPTPPVEKPPPSAGKPYLGISLDDLSDEERKGLGLAAGVKIGEVRGPAEKAGLKPGDILVEIDGQAVTEEKLPELLGKHKPGDILTATVVRAKKRESVKVTLGERKE